MTEESKVTEIGAFKDKGAKALKKSVTREEFGKTISDIVDNINKIADYCMQDVNAMYAKQVFPFQMNLNALIDLLIEKDIITREELDKKVADYQAKLVEQAKTIQEGAEAPKEDK